MSQPYWNDDPQAWDTVILGPYTLPGLVIVHDGECGSDIEIKKTKGQNLPTLEDQGRDSSVINIEVILARREHWVAWCAIVPKINPRRADATKDPYEIVYPDLNLLGINKVVIRKIKPKPPTAGGAKRYFIDCVEWAPEPKKKTAGKKTAWAALPKQLWQQTPQELAYTPTGLDALNRMFDNGRVQNPNIF